MLRPPLLRLQAVLCRSVRVLMGQLLGVVEEIRTELAELELRLVRAQPREGPPGVSRSETMPSD